MAISEPGISDINPTVFINIFKKYSNSVNICLQKLEKNRLKMPRGAIMKLTSGMAIKFPKTPDALNLLNVALEIGVVASVAMRVVIIDANIYAADFPKKLSLKIYFGILSLLF
ncbi:hypothetical protein FACS1894113_0620 [Alphaproteobacteria bacterium]|nr:hypothetical protein FACS1894113_0620 [Alphaproteobacteria bacterium]